MVKKTKQKAQPRITKNKELSEQFLRLRRHGGPTHSYEFISFENK